MTPLIRSTTSFLSSVRQLGLAASPLLASALPVAAQTITGTSPVMVWARTGEAMANKSDAAIPK